MDAWTTYFLFSLFTFIGCMFFYILGHRRGSHWVLNQWKDWHNDYFGKEEVDN